MPLDRRDFLKTLAAAPLAGIAATRALSLPAEPRRGGLKILILGGTGFLGPHVVDARSRAATRSRCSTAARRTPGLFPNLEKLHGDRDGKLEALEGRKWDAVVDTSGYVPRIVKMSADLLARRRALRLRLDDLGLPEDGTPRTPTRRARRQDRRRDRPRRSTTRTTARSRRSASRRPRRRCPARVANVRPGLIVGPGDPTRPVHLLAGPRARRRRGARARQAGLVRSSSSTSATSRT